VIRDGEVVRLPSLEESRDICRRAVLELRPAELTVEAGPPAFVATLEDAS
jgi:hypothetical protein